MVLTKVHGREKSRLEGIFPFLGMSDTHPVTLQPLNGNCFLPWCVGVVMEDISDYIPQVSTQQQLLEDPLHYSSYRGTSQALPLV